MNYNQQISTTTSTCLENSVSGYYCSIYQNETITTYNYFDLIILCLPIIIIFIMIGIFRKKKKNNNLI